MWLSNPTCEETIQAAQYHTSSLDPSNEILKKIERCGPDLSWWNRNVFGSVRQELIRKKELLHRAKNVAMILGDNSRVQELKAEINVLLDREARMWAQRFRLLWAGEGDKNTKYFHSRATKRYRKNQIVGIKDGQES